MHTEKTEPTLDTSADTPASESAEAEQNIVDIENASEAPEPTAEELLMEAQARILALEAEAEEQKNNALRALAEAENTRKRTQREIAQVRRYASESLAKSLFGVADNLKRALDAVAPESVEDHANAKNLRIGVEMTLKDFDQAFQSNQIEKIDPVGEPFDPNAHQAMFEIPTDEATPGTVMQCITPGYRLHDRLLRAAMVGVAKAAPPAPEQNDA